MNPDNRSERSAWRFVLKGSLSLMPLWVLDTADCELDFERVGKPGYSTSERSSPRVLTPGNLARSLPARYGTGHRDLC